MAIDITELVEFYRTPLGRIARTLVSDAVHQLMGDVTAQRVMGLGFATPYLGPCREHAERVIAMMPARQGIIHWPKNAPAQTVLVDPLELPLTDAAIDVVVAVHAFEHVADTEELMRELWRITAPGARLIVVVPRRRGLWAQRDNTPFGHGHPFSKSQLGQLLKSHSFMPERWLDVLYLPPADFKPLLKSARLFEGGGRLLGSALAGATVVRALRQSYPAIARRQRASRFVRLPEMAPQPALPTQG